MHGGLLPVPRRWRYGAHMGDDKREREETQTTQNGLEIPVPERDDFLRNLRKTAPPAPEPERDDES